MTADWPASLWAATAPPAEPTGPLEEAIRADIAIVGGGFTGLSAALHLAIAGVRVALVESHAPGWGASGRNGGQVIPGWKDDPETLAERYGTELGARMSALGDGAADVLYGIIARHRIDCALRRCGWIQALHSPALRPAVERRVRAWQRLGAPVQVLGKDETNTLLGTEDYAGGYLDPRGGALNPLAYARGLAAAATALGARLFAPARATRLSHQRGRWHIEVPPGRITADEVLIATGATSGDMVAGLRRSLLPVQSVQVATAPLPEAVRLRITPGGQVVSDTRRLLLYFRLEPDGRLVFGGRGALSGEQVTPAIRRAVTAAMHATFPATRGADVTHVWAGLVDLTWDRRLHVHRPAPGMTVVVGFNGRGVAQATAVGKAVAEAIARDAFADLPLPVVPLRAIPLHALRRPAMGMVAAVYRLRDRMETMMR